MSGRVNPGETVNISVTAIWNQVVREGLCLSGVPPCFTLLLLGFLSSTFEMQCP